MKYISHSKYSQDKKIENNFIVDNGNLSSRSQHIGLEITDNWNEHIFLLTPTIAMHNNSNNNSRNSNSNNNNNHNHSNNNNNNNKRNNTVLIVYNINTQNNYKKVGGQQIVKEKFSTNILFIRLIRFLNVSVQQPKITVNAVMKLFRMYHRLNRLGYNNLPAKLSEI